MATTASAPAAPAPKPKSRMTLEGVVKGKQAEPLTLTLYGVEGIGKSTFASAAPGAIFIDGESSTANLDVERFPRPASWEDVKEAVRVLTDDAHQYQTAVFDTVDWLEPLLWDYCCRRDKQESIESYGYGKGYVAALDEWRVFIASLERLRRVKQMGIILIGHSWIKPYKNPLGEDFDRYELKIHPKAAGLIKEWPSTVLFANHETVAMKDPKTKRVRGVDTGARLLYTERSAAYDAKNRHGLPPTLPLDWASFWEAMTAAKAPSVEVADRAEVARRAKELGGDLGAKAIEGLTRADTAEKLAILANWINAHLSEKGA
jgi:hypothetical protein